MATISGDPHRSRYPASMRSLRQPAPLRGVFLLSAGLGLLLLGGTSADGRGSIQDAPDFVRDVQPILSEHCFECHGRHQQKAGLRLDQRAAALAGSDFGSWSVIVPGDRLASELFQTVARGDMPPTEGAGPTAAEVELLGRWIDAGAEWPDDGEAASWPTRHWAYQPLERPEVPSGNPWSPHPVDAFLFESMADVGLAPSPEADRGTLLRRASFDLTGLPPSDADIAVFNSDTGPGAWNRAIDRLLASPHYGEHQARRWLDLARYADSNGYDIDGARSMWPWRDWVVRAFNADMPFDRFTVEQLAGDLLPESTLEQRLATGFHRNTMTNEEGGTDAEEFRVAAVVDRVNTTGEVWLGTTMGCAQCHDHKLDPVTQADYYRLFAVFDQTSDNGKGLAPTLAVPTPEDAQRIAEIESELDSIRATLEPDPSALEAWAADVRARLAATEVRARDVPWFEGVRPPASVVEGAWSSVPDETAPVARARAIDQRTGGYAQNVVRQTRVTPVVRAGDRLYAVLWLDPLDPPRELLLQWHAPEHEGWEHRAFWGEDLHGLGTAGTSSRFHAGDLPSTGAWVRIEVDAAAVGLEAGDRVDGFAFGQHSGHVRWAHAGIVSTDPRVQANVPDEVAAALSSSEGIGAGARDWFVEIAPEHDTARERIAQLEAERPKPPTSLVLEAVAEPRTTHVLERGSFLSPGAEVGPGVPAVLDADRRAGVETRLDLARWLVADDNPLTARVTANRLWTGIFGLPLVATPEDFGTSGAAPTHPALLDWLASELIRLDWSVKEFQRSLVTSAAYRQSSVITPRIAELDPNGARYARFPARRLDGEELRDQALALAGLLDRRLGGPPVFPPQPAGTDNATYAGDRWRTSTGADAHRRGLYTFWRRTSPYPTFVLFDAPSREVSCARRDRSNTPLQALALLNDPSFVAAAEGLAERLDERGLAWGFEACTGRPADDTELEILAVLRETDGSVALAQVLLNLDETVTRR